MMPEDCKVFVGLLSKLRISFKVFAISSCQGSKRTPTRRENLRRIAAGNGSELETLL